MEFCNLFPSWLDANCFLSCILSKVFFVRSANSIIFANTVGNGGPLAMFKACTYNFKKLLILLNIAFGQISMPNSYNSGACSHAEVKACAHERAGGKE
jgi:hypothetical protein